MNALLIILAGLFILIVALAFDEGAGRLLAPSTARRQGNAAAAGDDAAPEAAAREGVTPESYAPQTASAETTINRPVSLQYPQTLYVNTPQPLTVEISAAGAEPRAAEDQTLDELGPLTFLASSATPLLEVALQYDPADFACPRPRLRQQLNPHGATLFRFLITPLRAAPRPLTVHFFDVRRQSTTETVLSRTVITEQDSQGHVIGTKISEVRQPAGQTSFLAEVKAVDVVISGRSFLGLTSTQLTFWRTGFGLALTALLLLAALLLGRLQGGDALLAIIVAAADALGIGLLPELRRLLP